MGFTTGLLGGATLTYSLLYLSLYLHRANRQHQHIILSQQSTILNSVIEPLPPLPDPPAYEVRKTDLVETLKDRWNSEIEGAVRNLQETDWEEVRERWEARVGNVWRNIRHSQAGDELKQRFRDTVGKTEEVGRTAGNGLASANANPAHEARLLELK